MKYGNFAVDLYGTDQDLRLQSIFNRGELVPTIVKDEEGKLNVIALLSEQI